MATQERRNFMPLDYAYQYCRNLESGERPQLFKLCSSLRTVDKALTVAAESRNAWSSLSIDAWSKIRDSLYNALITSFPGYFMVYGQSQGEPQEAGTPWPAEGYLEFVPSQMKRREDTYRSPLDHLESGTVSALRWCFANGRQQVSPSDFQPNGYADLQRQLEDEEQASAFMDHLYEQCAREATYGKKRAHQKWWQLYWEADSCKDRHQKQEYRKEMVQLQAVWGRPN